MGKVCKKCKREFAGSYCKECYKEYRKGYRESQRGFYVYIVVDKNKVLYVGASEILKERINSHLNKHTRIKDLISTNDWTSIKYFDVSHLVTNREEMLLVENTLIDLYEPKYNMVKNIIKNITGEREFIIISEIHSSMKWEVFCTNKK